MPIQLKWLRLKLLEAKVERMKVLMENSLGTIQRLRLVNCSLLQNHFHDSGDTKRTDDDRE